MPARRLALSSPLSEDKETQPAAAEPEPFLFHQLPARTLTPAITGHPIIRRIALILQNGTKYAAHAQIRFSAQPGLLIQMHRAYESYQRQPGEEAEQAFLDQLQIYLEQAATHIPQAGRLSEVPAMMQQLKDLLAETESGGLALVGRYLLAVAHAPVDRF